MTRSASGPDDGAREIHRLLTAPNLALRDALRRQTAALPHAIVLDASAARLSVPFAALEATDDLRRILRGVSNRVAAIKTNRNGPKRRALDALDRLDFAWALLADGLTASDDKRTAELAREAYWERDHAVTALKKALVDLR